MTGELIYIGECEHLENCTIHDDDCLKRYITIFNPKVGRNQILVFCNDYLKLKAQELVKKENRYAWQYYNKPVVDAIKNEILLYLNLDERGRPIQSGNIARYVKPLVICQRPYAVTYVGIRSLIEWYWANPTYEGMESIKAAMFTFLEGLTSVASKTAHKKLISMAKKLRHHTYTDEDLTEFVNETFKLITNKALKL